MPPPHMQAPPVTPDRDACLHSLDEDDGGCANAADRDVERATSRGWKKAPAQRGRMDEVQADI